jgi:integrase
MAKELISDLEIRKAKREAQRTSAAILLYDGDGLRFRVAPSGVVSAQLKYRLAGTPQVATIGKLDRIGGLGAARKKAEELRPLAEEGVHLTVHKREQRVKRKADAAATFGKYSEEWVKREARRQKWTESYRDEVGASITNHLSNPKEQAGLDGIPLVKITAAMVASLLHSTERRAPNMLEKVQRRLHAILDDAVHDGILTGNPLPRPRRRSRKGERQHYPAITKLDPIGEVLRAARASDPCKGIQRAHMLLAFTAQRVGEIVPTRWDEFDLDAAEWSIPRERMKRKDAERGPHVIPVPPALLAQLREWREADGLGAIYLCPAPRDRERHITEEAVEKFYRTKTGLGLAGKHSPHSWRAAFSTICRDHGKDGDVIEAQLDHVVGSKVQSAYDRSHRLELRRELVKWYELTLIAARDGADVVPIKAAKK